MAGVSVNNRLKEKLRWVTNWLSAAGHAAQASSNNDRRKAPEHARITEVCWGRLRSVSRRLSSKELPYMTAAITKPSRLTAASRLARTVNASGRRLASTYRTAQPNVRTGSSE